VVDLHTGHYFRHKDGGRFICGSPYMRVYTVINRLINKKLNQFKTDVKGKPLYNKLFD